VPRRRCLRWLQVLAGLLSVILLGSTAASCSAGASTRSKPARPLYYVALGDSLSTGGGATPGHSYVDDVYAYESARIRHLRLKNLGCAGDTTTKMIHGGSCQYKTGTAQLTAAEAFLRKHRGHIAFITIDVGGDDIVGCAVKVTTISPQCVKNALAKINANLPVILSGIRQAGGNVPTAGMTYYDPILAAYLTGPPMFPQPDDRSLARESLTMLKDLNTELRAIYGRSDVVIANGQRAFHSFDTARTGSFEGQTLPQDVANICNWTHMCLTGGGNPNIHANDTGHALLAGKFDAALHPLLHRLERK
jgi:lysophospholipase L1-like esterase